MIFEQHYLDCLSHASYLIGDESTGRAVVVDPQRDVAAYLESAKEHGLEVELVIETHFHADFLSGHLELAEATGAEIAFGARGETEFPSRKLADGERISLGDVTLQILQTPGHTPESISVVVYEHADDAVPYGVLTGDTLFIGDVGRPDLLASVGVTAGELGDQLYDSLHDKLMKLPDATRVYPAHGAGSACGKNLSTDTWSTIGQQRVENYAVQPMTKGEFVDIVTEGQPSAPSYFIYDAVKNRQARGLLDESEHPRALSFNEAMEHVDAGAALVDTRDAADFAKAHFKGSVNVGIDGRFAEYTGSVVSPEQDIVLVAEPDAELEAKVRLGRIGFDKVVGFVDRLYAEMLENEDRVESASRLTAEAFDARRAEVADLQVVDVRNPGEITSGTVPGAMRIPVAELAARVEELDPERPTVVYCAGGYRSSIAASLLRARGFGDVSDIIGGYEAWSKAAEPAG